MKLTDDGGLAVLLTNKTGAPSVKGYCVTTSSTTQNAVELVAVGVPNCIGVFLENGTADGDQAWVVVSGLAYVYFSVSSNAGYLARTGLASDTGEATGQAMSEAFPAAPFATDKHFCEIGHCLETRATPGLAKVNLHFN